MTNTLRGRAEVLAARAKGLRELSMLQRAEQAQIIAEDMAALLLDACDRIDALTPYLDEDEGYPNEVRF